jgi:hypothetical protein
MMASRGWAASVLDANKPADGECAYGGGLGLGGLGGLGGGGLGLGGLGGLGGLQAWVDARLSHCTYI